MPRTGRRVGDAGTRETILEAARAEFAASGYSAATIRAIARRAVVDPALVYHYFADKPALFVATLDMPADPRSIRDATQASGSPGASGLRTLATCASGRSCAVSLLTMAAFALPVSGVADRRTTSALSPCWAGNRVASRFCACSDPELPELKLLSKLPPTDTADAMTATTARTQITSTQRRWS